MGKKRKDFGRDVAERARISTIIGDIRKQEGFDREQILHSFKIARTCDTHSVCLPLTKGDGTMADLKIMFDPPDQTERYITPVYSVTLDGILIGEKELRELVG